MCWLGFSPDAPTRLVLMICSVSLLMRLRLPPLLSPHSPPLTLCFFLPFLLLVLFSDGELLSVRLPGALLWCLSLIKASRPLPFPPLICSKKAHECSVLTSCGSFLAGFLTPTPTPTCWDTSVFYENYTCVSMTRILGERECVCMYVCAIKWVSEEVLTHQAKGKIMAIRC